MTLHLADAVELDLAALDPPPTKVVANLPYGVAATVLLRSRSRSCPARGLWVAMVQREVGERLAAAPGSKVYGTTSVLAQLACEVKVLRRVPRDRLPPGGRTSSRRSSCCAAAGRRRRATLSRSSTPRSRTGARRSPGSLALAPGAPAGLRDAARAGLEGLGLPTDARAERLTPEQFAELAGAIGTELLEPLKARRS